jgi:hypothetical protein
MRKAYNEKKHRKTVDNAGKIRQNYAPSLPDTAAILFFNNEMTDRCGCFGVCVLGWEFYLD